MLSVSSDPRSGSPVRAQLGVLVDLYETPAADLTEGETIDAVASVKLKVKAGGVLAVEVTERKPAILWRTDGTLEMLDATGHRVATLLDRSRRADLPVIAGTGSNNTAEALRLTKHAWEAGADGALIVAPYYNRPTQEGLYQHFKIIAESVPIPIIPYNIPGRTGVNMLPGMVAKLA